ncbi:MAG TPA: hypothetical protein VLA43_21435 [Longimicrobiales bacterium]|nr:hypothetical protein [Longimicrobiales bacterium]
MAIAGRSEATAILTGTVDLIWPGGQGAGAPNDQRAAQAEISAFAGVPPGSPGPGTFVYRVMSPGGLLHREVGVELTWAGLDDQTEAPNDFRFLGVVVWDTKPCGGSGPGTGGGCGEEGGCSHDDGSNGEEGGCSHDEGATGEEGGCSHDDGSTHDEGGCSGGGAEGGTGDPGGPGGPSGRVTGADCRIGQVVIGWALDGGTPATAGDRISWKWMAPDAPKVLAIREAMEAGDPVPWPCKLCEKQIVGGNVVLRLGTS